MKPGLKIVIADPDEDYLGIEIHAASERFAGATRIYARHDELGAIASQIEGFPASPNDERKCELGTIDPGFAGGFCSLCFCCVDQSGHAALTVVLEDDDQYYTPASATFRFSVLAADVDRFIAVLRVIEKNRKGEAVLAAKV